MRKIIGLTLFLLFLFSPIPVCLAQNAPAQPPVANCGWQANPNSVAQPVVITETLTTLKSCSLLVRLRLWQRDGGNADGTLTFKPEGHDQIRCSTSIRDPNLRPNEIDQIAIEAMAIQDSSSIDEKDVTDAQTISKALQNEGQVADEKLDQAIAVQCP